jgi:hypothetical protein
VGSDVGRLGPRARDYLGVCFTSKYHANLARFPFLVLYDLIKSKIVPMLKSRCPHWHTIATWTAKTSS